MISQLRPANAEPSQEVIERLEVALELARKGELRAVYIGGDLMGHEAFSSTSFEDGIVLLGHLQRAIHIVNRAMVDE